MFDRVASIDLRGMEAYLVHVEVKVMIGVDSIVIVGLPDASVKESKERVAAALHSQGYSLSSQKIIIHLSPAELKKNGPLFDLAMAISILVSLKELKPIIPEHTGFIGSLSLDGRVQPVEGMLPAVLAAKKLGLKKLYMPFDERLPALEFTDLEIVYVSSLEEVILHLNGQEIIPLFQRAKVVENQSHSADFKKIVDYSYAKYALEVAAGVNTMFL